MNMTRFEEYILSAHAHVITKLLQISRRCPSTHHCMLSDLTGQMSLHKRNTKTLTPWRRYSTPRNVCKPGALQKRIILCMIYIRRQRCDRLFSGHRQSRRDEREGARVDGTYHSAESCSLHGMVSASAILR